MTGSGRTARPDHSWLRADARLAWTLVLPALLVLAAAAVAPIAWTAWESVHLHDLRMPWLGRPFVGLANYGEAFGDVRFRSSVLHTLAFAGITVPLEMGAGLGLGLAMDRLVFGKRLVRTAVLLPWAVPTVIAALVWRFIFESPSGLASMLVERAGLTAPTWLADPVAAWLPIVLADVWKSTPFVAVLLLAGLQRIDASLYEAASIDGAGRFQQFRSITVPLLGPTLLVALLFRLLDALRVFDAIYVLTSGGPGTATEPVALYTFTTLLRSLRFGYGAALSMIVFIASAILALAVVRVLGSTRD